MHDEIDYFAIERMKDLNEGSPFGMIKELIGVLRHVREEVPANEIDRHMPAAYAIEKKLHNVNDVLSEPHKPYVQEIWEALENEPEPDDTKTFQVFELIVNEDGQGTLTNTYESFPQHIIAEEWIKESGEKGMRYVILEVIEP